jgi:hypothetical protein
MAQVTGRINLSARTFPFVSANWGRTVIVPTSVDNNFNRQVQSSQDSDHDVGIPQAYYMHNVMPHAQGYQSVAYTQIVSPSSTEVTFKYVRELKDNIGNYALLGVCSNGKWYVRETAGVWTLVYTSAYPTLPVYIAYINGITYIYQKNVGLQIYSWLTHSFSSAVFLGIDSTVIDGITASFGYMIAWASINGGYAINGVATIGLNSVNAVIGPARVGDLISSTFFPVGTQITAVDFLNNVIYLTAVSTGNGATTLTKQPSPGAVYWSSTINELDFVPSLITGAGGGQVQGAQGLVTLCLAHTTGFIVYTTKNAVGAAYSGNARYPFNFNAIVGSGGLTDFALVTQEGDTGNHYAYTTNGVQLMSIGSAQTVLTDVTDFISGKLFEDFDDIAKTFSLTRLSSTLVKKLTIINARYLVLSYGIISLTHALVYDLITQRFGKLRTPHVFSFEVAPNVTNVITDLPRQAIGLLQNDGTVKIVDFDVYNPLSNGTLILGKYQYVRARNLILDQFWLENIYNPATFNCTVMTSLDGKVVSSLDVPVLALSAGGQSKYGARSEGQNISLLLQGQFHIESGVLAFNLGGKR